MGRRGAAIAVTVLRYNCWIFLMMQMSVCLSLSVPKSCVVIFTRKRHIPDVNIIYNNQNIPVLNRVKFLGVLLESKLSGSPHIEYVSNKYDKNLQILDIYLRLLLMLVSMNIVLRFLGYFLVLRCRIFRCGTSILFYCL